MATAGLLGPRPTTNTGIQGSTTMWSKNQENRPPITPTRTCMCNLGPACHGMSAAFACLKDPRGKFVAVHTAEQYVLFAEALRLKPAQEEDISPPCFVAAHHFDPFTPWESSPTEEEDLVQSSALPSYNFDRAHADLRTCMRQSLSKLQDAAEQKRELRRSRRKEMLEIAAKTIKKTSRVLGEVHQSTNRSIEPSSSWKIELNATFETAQEGEMEQFLDQEEQETTPTKQLPQEEGVEVVLEETPTPKASASSSAVPRSIVFEETPTPKASASSAAVPGSIPTELQEFYRQGLLIPLTADKNDPPSTKQEEENQPRSFPAASSPVLPVESPTPLSKAAANPFETAATEAQPTANPFQAASAARNVNPFDATATAAAPNPFGETAPGDASAAAAALGVVELPTTDTASKVKEKAVPKGVLEAMKLPPTQQQQQQKQLDEDDDIDSQSEFDLGDDESSEEEQTDLKTTTDASPPPPPQIQSRALPLAPSDKDVQEMGTTTGEMARSIIQEEEAAKMKPEEATTTQTKVDEPPQVFFGLEPVSPRAPPKSLLADADAGANASELGEYPPVDDFRNLLKAKHVVVQHSPAEDRSSDFESGEDIDLGDASSTILNDERSLDSKPMMIFVSQAESEKAARGELEVEPSLCHCNSPRNIGLFYACMMVLALGNIHYGRVLQQQHQQQLLMDPIVGAEGTAEVPWATDDGEVNPMVDLEAEADAMVPETGDKDADSTVDSDKTKTSWLWRSSPSPAIEEATEALVDDGEIDAADGNLEEVEAESLSETAENPPKSSWFWRSSPSPPSEDDKSVDVDIDTAEATNADVEADIPEGENLENPTEPVEPPPKSSSWFWRSAPTSSPGDTSSGGDALPEDTPRASDASTNESLDSGSSTNKAFDTPETSDKSIPAEEDIANEVPKKSSWFWRSSPVPSSDVMDGHDDDDAAVTAASAAAHAEGDQAMDTRSHVDVEVPSDAVQTEPAVAPKSSWFWRSASQSEPDDSSFDEGVDGSKVESEVHSNNEDEAEPKSQSNTADEQENDMDISGTDVGAEELKPGTEKESGSKASWFWSRSSSKLSEEEPGSEAEDQNVNRDPKDSSSTIAEANASIHDEPYASTVENTEGHTDGMETGNENVKATQGVESISSGLQSESTEENKTGKATESSQPDTKTLKKGDRVTLKEMKKTKYNGKHGIIVSLPDESPNGRYGVKVAGALLGIKPTNLAQQMDEAEDVKSSSSWFWSRSSAAVDSSEANIDAKDIYAVDTTDGSRQDGFQAEAAASDSSEVPASEGDGKVEASPAALSDAQVSKDDELDDSSSQISEGNVEDTVAASKEDSAWPVDGADGKVDESKFEKASWSVWRSQDSSDDSNQKEATGGEPESVTASTEETLSGETVEDKQTEETVESTEPVTVSHIEEEGHDSSEDISASKEEEDSETEGIEEVSESKVNLSQDSVFMESLSAEGSLPQDVDTSKDSENVETSHSNHGVDTTEEGGASAETAEEISKDDERTIAGDMKEDSERPVETQSTVEEGEQVEERAENMKSRFWGSWSSSSNEESEIAKEEATVQSSAASLDHEMPVASEDDTEAVGAGMDTVTRKDDATEEGFDGRADTDEYTQSADKSFEMNSEGNDEAQGESEPTSMEDPTEKLITAEGPDEVQASESSFETPEGARIDTSQTGSSEAQRATETTEEVEGGLRGLKDPIDEDGEPTLVTNTGEDAGQQHKEETKKAWWKYFVSPGDKQEEELVEEGAIEETSKQMSASVTSDVVSSLEEHDAAGEEAENRGIHAETHASEERNLRGEKIENDDDKGGLLTEATERTSEQADGEAADEDQPTTAGGSGNGAEPWSLRGSLNSFASSAKSYIYSSSRAEQLHESEQPMPESMDDSNQDANMAEEVDGMKETAHAASDKSVPVADRSTEVFHVEGDDDLLDFDALDVAAAAAVDLAETTEEVDTSNTMQKDTLSEEEATAETPGSAWQWTYKLRRVVGLEQETNKIKAPHEDTLPLDDQLEEKADDATEERGPELTDEVASVEESEPSSVSGVDEEPSIESETKTSDSAEDAEDANAPSTIAGTEEAESGEAPEEKVDRDAEPAAAGLLGKWKSIATSFADFAKYTKDASAPSEEIHDRETPDVLPEPGSEDSAFADEPEIGSTDENEVASDFGSVTDTSELEDSSVGAPPESEEMPPAVARTTEEGISDLQTPSEEATKMQDSDIESNSLSWTWEEEEHPKESQVPEQIVLADATGKLAGSPPDTASGIRSFVKQAIVSWYNSGFALESVLLITGAYFYWSRR